MESYPLRTSAVIARRLESGARLVARLVARLLQGPQPAQHPGVRQRSYRANLSSP